MRLGPRTGQRWPKFPKHVLFVTSPQENLPPKPKIFFLILTRRLFESVEGLNSSLALAARDLWSKNCVKGLQILDLVY